MKNPNKNNYQITNTDKLTTIKFEGNCEVDYEYLWDRILMAAILQSKNTQVISGEHADIVKFKRPTIIEIKIKR